MKAKIVNVQELFSARRERKLWMPMFARNVPYIRSRNFCCLRNLLIEKGNSDIIKTNNFFNVAPIIIFSYDTTSKSSTSFKNPWASFGLTLFEGIVVEVGRSCSMTCSKMQNITLSSWRMACQKSEKLSLQNFNFFAGWLGAHFSLYALLSFV